MYICLDIYIYIFFFAPSLSFASEYFSEVSSRIKFTSFNEFALFLGLNAARWTYAVREKIEVACPIQREKFYRVVREPMKYGKRTETEEIK